MQVTGFEKRGRSHHLRACHWHELLTVEMQPSISAHSDEGWAWWRSTERRSRKRTTPCGNIILFLQGSGQGSLSTLLRQDEAFGDMMECHSWRKR